MKAKGKQRTQKEVPERTIILGCVSEEVLERAMILGFLPEDHIRNLASLVERTIMNNPKIEYSRECQKIPILDETINMIGDTATAFLLRMIYPNGNKKIKMAVHASKACGDWLKRNGPGSKNLTIARGVPK